MPGILVALDRSAGSERALEAAVKLAQLDGGQVSAVVVMDGQSNSSPDESKGGTVAHVRSRADELLQTAGNFARSRGVLLTPILREGHPADSIVTCAREEEAAVLVLGANSEATAGDLGDTAEKVIRRSPCTVLVVR